MGLTNRNGKERTETDRMCHVNKRNADSGKKGFRKQGGHLRLAPTAKLICLSDTCTAENAT